MIATKLANSTCAILTRDFRTYTYPVKDHIEGTTARVESDATIEITDDCIQKVNRGMSQCGESKMKSNKYNFVSDKPR